MAQNPPAVQEPQEARVQSLGWKIPWRRARQPTPVFLPGEPHGQRSLLSYSPQGRKESELTEETLHARMCAIHNPDFLELFTVEKHSKVQNNI